ncbi:ATP-binding cassette, subfamily G [Acrasis kona]|uniref:ATP-binding cassette, subfamily G n=1 Tax=Acrasis kona TaxID=1008807 RepID=A0AAW2YL05_9EUKA
MHENVALDVPSDVAISNFDDVSKENDNPKVYLEWIDLEYIVQVKKRSARGPKKVARPTSISSVPLTNEDKVVVEPNLSAATKFKYLLRSIFRKETVPKYVLSRMSGYVAPGSVLAIMGPSGAGKTSFLNIIAQRVTRYNGKVLISGEPVPKSWRTISGFVQQDDVLMGNLTVRETLRYAAMLKMPGSISMKDKMKRVDAVMRELGLDKPGVADTVIGQPGLKKGISGGERKRVAIAIELLTEPSVLFLDEPTSGLDSKTSLNVMETISRIAARGRTVILTIHQPRSDIYNRFDKLLLLARGRVAYIGDAGKTAVDYFASLGYKCPNDYNPAEYFIDLVSETTSGTQTIQGPSAPTVDVEMKDVQQEAPKAMMTRDDMRAADNQRIELLLDHYTNNVLPEYKSPVIAEENKVKNLNEHARNNFLSQFVVILIRSFTSIVRDKALSFVGVIQMIVLGLIVGLIFLRLDRSQAGVQNRLGALFFILTQQTIRSMFANVSDFLQNARPIFLRERGAKMYTVLPYYLATTLAMVPNGLFLPLIFSIISYFMIGLNPSADRFFMHLLITEVACQSMQSVGMLMSYLFSNMGVAMAILPIANTTMMIFAGFYINVGSIPPWFIWIYWITPMHYGFEALVLNEFYGTTFECPAPPATCMYPTGEAVIQKQNMTNPLSNVWIDLAMLMLINFVCRFLAFLVLRFFKINKPKGG